MKIITENKKSNNVKVSILISTYNKGKFIKKTLDSILNQTFDLKKLEVIVVDDCSTDDTLEVVASNLTNFYNYKLVQLDQNSGTPAQPRNLSIDLSKGKYLMFIDGDDWLPENAVETLYNLLKKNKTDYATGLTNYVFNDKVARAGVALSKIAHSKLDLNQNSKSFYHLAPHGRMVKASIIKNNNIRFPEMIFAEDLQFFAEVFFHVDKISTTEDVVYFTNRYQDNVSLVKSKESTMPNRMKLQMDAYKYLSKKYKNLKVFRNLLIRLINKDILNGKFYKKTFIREIDVMLPLLQDAINTIEKDFDVNKYVDDELNKKAIELIKKGDKAEIIAFIKWYSDKDDEQLQFKRNKVYYSYNNELFLKHMHVTLQNIIRKNNSITLKLYSKNSHIEFMELKSRKNPEQYQILKIKKNNLKPGEYSVKFDTSHLPKGKLAITVLDADLNSTVVKTNDQFNLYETVNGNLGYKS